MNSGEGGILPFSPSTPEVGSCSAPRTAFRPKSDSASVTQRKPPTATPEQQAAGRLKARETAAANRARLRSDFLSDDEAEWSRLAAAAGITLPFYGVPCSTALFRRYLAPLGVETEEYMEWDGDRRLGDFIGRNPDFPGKAWVGMVLMAIEDGTLAATGAARPDGRT